METVRGWVWIFSGIAHLGFFMLQTCIENMPREAKKRKSQGLHLYLCLTLSLCKFRNCVRSPAISGN